MKKIVTKNFKIAQQFIEDSIDEDLAKQDKSKSLPVLDSEDIASYLEDEIESQKDGNMAENPEDNIGKPDLDDYSEKTINKQPEEKNIVPVPENKTYPSFPSVEQAVTWANNNNECVFIAYTTLKGTYIERVIEPHGLYYAKTTRRNILITFDETIEDIRAFIVNNISNYYFINKKFNKKFIFKN